MKSCYKQSITSFFRLEGKGLCREEGQRDIGASCWGFMERLKGSILGRLRAGVLIGL